MLGRAGQRGSYHKGFFHFHICKMEMLAATLIDALMIYSAFRSEAQICPMLEVSVASRAQLAFAGELHSPARSLLTHGQASGNS